MKLSLIDLSLAKNIINRSLYIKIAFILTLDYH